MFYHRTTEEAWQKIQQEKILYGISSTAPKHRHTYLSPTDWGDSYGPVLLRVKYIPCGRFGIDTYCFERPFGTVCWQFIVFKPIPIDMVERIKKKEFIPPPSRR